MTTVAAAAAALASSRAEAAASEAALRALLTAAKQPRGWAPNDVLAYQGALPALVEQLSADATTARSQLAVQSLVLLVAMTSANEKRVIGAAGALPPLVRLLSSATGADAAKALWVLCWDCEEHQRPVAALGALPRLVALLHMGDEDGQRCAAGAIERICLNDASLRVAAARAGAIAPLVRLLGDGRALHTTVCGIRGTHHDFTGRMAHALWALVQDDALAAEDARDVGAVPPLVELLGKEVDNTAVKGAAGALLARLPLAPITTIH